MYIREWTPRRAALGARPARRGRSARTERAPEEHLETLSFSDRELAPVRELRERFQGAMQGLAVGDALAAATQFRRAGSFAPVGDLLGGGPFDLPRGAWSDDTAMALCLAESLTERDGFDAADQLARYTRWQREGYLSATGQCLGITAATARALAAAQWRGRPLSESSDPAPLESEPLSRVAPIVLHFFADARGGGGAGGGRGPAHQPVAAGARCLPVAGRDAACGAARRAARARARARSGGVRAHPLREPVAAHSHRAASVRTTSRRPPMAGRSRCWSWRAGAWPGAQIFATAPCARST